MAEAWFEQAIAVGLARLAALALPGTPIDERSAAACRAVWVDALWPGRAWAQHLDAARIEEAFRQLAARCKRWPAPADFLEALPARPQPVPLPPPSLSEAQRAQVRQRLAELVAKMRMG